jgi:membrane protein involved in colicin uptake
MTTPANPSTATTTTTIGDNMSDCKDNGSIHSSQYSGTSQSVRTAMAVALDRAVFLALSRGKKAQEIKLAKEAMKAEKKAAQQAEKKAKQKAEKEAKQKAEKEAKQKAEKEVKDTK